MATTTNLIFDAIILPTRRALASLTAILSSASAHASASSLETSSYINARIYDDMLPFHFQIHIITDTARKAVLRLARPGSAGRVSAEAAAFTSWKDVTPTWADFEKRVADTVKILEEVKPEDVEGREGETVELGLGPGKTVYPTAFGYAFGYSQPNMYFHLVTAYDILRKEGVPLGKTVYLAPFGEGIVPSP